MTVLLVLVGCGAGVSRGQSSLALTGIGCRESAVPLGKAWGQGKLKLQEFNELGNGQGEHVF